MQNKNTHDTSNPHGKKVSLEVEVIRTNRKTLSMEIRQGRLLVRAPLHQTDASIRDFIEKNRAWVEKNLARECPRQEDNRTTHLLTMEEIRNLADRALKVIPERVAYYAPLVGVTYGRITIRNQRSRWGSCTTAGNLNFNCLLMLAPPEVLDSVVVHELCHRKEMNHSDRFYAEVLRVYPDYWKHQQWLKQNGAALMSMMTGE